MEGSSLSKVRLEPLRRLLDRTALIACVSALLVMVSGAQQRPNVPGDSQLVSMERPTQQGPGRGRSPLSHRYFDKLAARPDAVASFSLRDQTQLDALVKAPPSTFFTFQPDTDKYAHPQDAAKLFKPARSAFLATPYGSVGDESVPGNQTLRIPLHIASGSLVITWDFWWGEEFQTNRGILDGLKTFMITVGDEAVYGILRNILGSDDRPFRDMPSNGISRHFDTFDPFNGADAPGVVGKGDPFTPTGLGAAPLRTFWTMSNTWTRYWVEIRINVPGREFTEWSQVALNEDLGFAGTWDMVSVWIADQDRDPVRVLYRVPVTPKPADVMFSEFRIAFNTSTHNKSGRGLDGPLVGYARNVVVLHTAKQGQLVDSVAATGPAPPANVRVIR